MRKVNSESKQKDETLSELKKGQFSYSDILKITNNFERVAGKGGFGTVYHGYLGDTQVAVKMLSPSSIQGYKQFQAEVNLKTKKKKILSYSKFRIFYFTICVKSTGESSHESSS